MKLFVGKLSVSSFCWELKLNVRCDGLLGQILKKKVSYPKALCIHLLGLVVRRRVEKQLKIEHLSFYWLLLGSTQAVTQVSPLFLSVYLSFVSACSFFGLSPLRYIASCRYSETWNGIIPPPSTPSMQKQSKLWRGPAVNPLSLFGASGGNCRGAGHRDTTTRRCRHKASCVYKCLQNKEFVHVI